MNHQLKYATILLTNFADQGVILPLSLSIGILLLLFKCKQQAIGWTISVVGTLVSVVVLKLVFHIVFSLISFSIHFSSPSSHVAAGSMVYGSLIALLIDKGYIKLKTAMYSSAIVAIIFSATRLGLQAHTRSEVIIGSFLGMLGCATFVYTCNTARLQSINKSVLVVVSLLVMIIFHGCNLNGEKIINDISGVISQDIKSAYHSLRS